MVGDTTMIHCKPGEAYTSLKTASCEEGLGTTHMCTLEICIWSLQIPNNAGRCAIKNSTFGFSKCYFYIDPLKYLKLSCQGSNYHPSKGLLVWFKYQKCLLQRLNSQPFDFQVVIYTITLGEIHIEEAKFTNL